MFGLFRKPEPAPGNVDRAEEWERSPTIAINTPTSNKTAYLLSNLGRSVEVHFRGEPIRITPTALFRKPAYGRSYVRADQDGESKAFNLSEVKLPPQVTIRLARRKLEPLTSTGAGRSFLSSFLGVALLVLGVVAAAAWYGGIVNLSDIGLDGVIAPVSESPPRLPDAPPTNPLNPPPPLITDAPPAPTTSPAAKEDKAIVPPTPPSAAEDSASTFGRVFTSKAGTAVRAEFVEFQFQGSRVILRKHDGQLLDVSMNDLSRDDQQWIREELKRRRVERSLPR